MKRYGHALALALALAGTPVAPAQGSVVDFLPPLWYVGDTHAHIQPCGSTSNISFDALYQEQQQEALDVLLAQFWNNQENAIGVQEYFNVFAPQVTGMENPVTAGSPAYFIQNGVEVAGFTASQFGHLTATGIQDGFFTEHFYPSPILDFFGSQPGALTGYAHVRWLLGYAQVPPSALPHNGNSIAPTDLALGLIDFIEASRYDLANANDWRGLYYKLLNSGLRVAITGGSDNLCIYPQVGAMRTYARIDSEPLDFAKWTEAVRDRRTSIAFGKDTFVDLQVNGEPIGSQVELAQPAMVTVDVSVHVAAGVAQSGTVELVKDGATIASAPYSLPSGGIATLNTQVQFNGSGWIAASIEHLAHTGASFVLVDDRPICRATDAQYWSDVGTDMINNLGGFTTGFETQEIQDHLREGRKVFDALAACGSPLPSGVTRFGTSTQACTGPIAIGVTGAPVVGSPFRLTNLNAPPDARGVLLIADKSSLVSSKLPPFLLPIGANVVLRPVHSNGGGYAEVTLTPPPSSLGQKRFARFYWLNTPECGGQAVWSTSDALSYLPQ